MLQEALQKEILPLMDKASQPPSLSRGQSDKGLYPARTIPSNPLTARQDNTEEGGGSLCKALQSPLAHLEETVAAEASCKLGIKETRRFQATVSEREISVYKSLQMVLERRVWQGFEKTFQGFWDHNKVCTVS